jgi:hypothetical protein
LLFLACSGGGDSNLPLNTGHTTSINTPAFDPTTGDIPLPNVLASAVAPDPLTGRTANKPMTPPEALAYVNLHEVGGTNAVSGMNAPIYLHFAAPVDPATVTNANIKVFQTKQTGTDLTTGLENNPLDFSEVSALFTYQYTAGGTDLFLFPNFPLLPGTRYLYVVTNRVKDAATGLPIVSPPYFEALKSTAPLAGAFAQLEAIRANKTMGTATVFSGYAKVMDDLIAASAKTTVASRSDIAVMGRFITTGAGFISTNTPSPADAGASIMPMEAALRAFALGSNPAPLPSGLPGATWSNAATIPANDPANGHIYTFTKGTPLSPDLYWQAVQKSATATAPATVGLVALGTINSANLSMDPVVVAANKTTIDLSAVAGAYNPAAGVVQAYRPDSLHLTGFYYKSNPISFVYIAPAGTAPAGGWPLVIFQHGVTVQKEYVLALAQSLTMIGRAVIAIDLPLHGANAVPGHTTGDLWGQDFMAIGAPLAARSNMQQAAFNLNRLEFSIRFGGFASLGANMPSMTDIKYIGHSLGSIVGAYYLAGNTSLSTTGYPYTQTTLNSDMKGYLSVPGARIAYLLQNSPAFGGSIDAGLAAVGITKNSVTYHQFFQATQSIFDPVDPASMTTPLATGLPSRLSNRVCIQESVGDQVIGNPYTRYLGNALGGREVLGTAGAAVAPGFKQLAYTAGSHAAGVPAQFMLTLNGTTPAPKVADAATTASAVTPTEGYFQFDQTGISHGSLLDPANMTNLALIQKQVRYFLGMGALIPGATSIVVDPTQGGAAFPIAPAMHKDVEVAPVWPILGF